MTQTYNGLTVPKTISPQLIISAFANEIEYSKVEQYTQIMQSEMMGHDFPPIMGYPVIIDENDTCDYFLNGEEVSDSMIGKLAWKVTDGHHRSLAAIAANLPHIEVKLDYGTITDPKDFINFNY